MMVLVFSIACTCTLSLGEPVMLRCEGSTEPAAIDTPHPHLSWVLRADQAEARNIKQTGYQILVASSKELLARDRGDLWDTGRVSSHYSIGIPYAGSALPSEQKVFWKVCVWTNTNDASSWSAPAEIIVGMLTPGDWAPAKWITAPDAKRLGIGYHAQPTADPAETKWVQVDLGSVQRVDTIRLQPVNHVGIAGFAFPVRFKVEGSKDASFQHAALIADRMTADVANPGDAPVDVPGGISVRYIRVTATRLVKRSNGYCFALGELAVLADGKDIAMGSPVTAKDSVESFGWSKTALTDGSPGGDISSYPSMLLRRTFLVKPGLKRAFFCGTGLGQYELSINEKKIGDQLLAPGWTNYTKTVLYDAFDVTEALHPGLNGIGIFLGNGMYDIEPSPGRYVKFTQSFGPPKAIGKLQLQYADGSTDTVTTDNSWQVAPGPITYSNVYGGEDFDGRLVQRGWDGPDLESDHSWKAAKETEGPGGTLHGESVAAPPISAIETHIPVATHSVRPDVTVYDLGQNASHMPRIAVSGPAGSYVRIIPSELLAPDGSVDRTSCVQDAGGSAWWQYTLHGGSVENYFPKFFYQGCRYFQVETYPAKAGSELPVIKSIRGVVVHSTSEPIGSFECSNELLNKTYTLVRWAQRSNMMSIMTDCPAREKLGWLEELHLNGPSLRYNFRMDRLYAKEMNDMADSQLPNGFVPNIAPEYFIAASSRLNDPFRNSPEWGSAFIIVPWQQYLFNGDPSLLSEHYDQMVHYVDFLSSTAKDNILTTGLGDWYDMGPKPPWGSQLTPPPLTATAIYFYDLYILSRAADLLGKSDDAIHFSAKAAEVRNAFNHKFFNPQKGAYSTGSQCANALPLALGIVDPDHRDSVLRALISDIEERKNALSAGDVGYRFVLRALADAGRSDVIFTMNNQSDRPGYGLQLKRGATSLTEKWDASVGSFGSQDHFMLGQINEWFFHDLAGIQPDEQFPGFSHIIIKPAVVGDITWVKATYESSHGPIALEWRREPDGIHLRVALPPNTTSTIYVGAAAPASAQELGSASGAAVRQSHVPGYAVFSAGSGSFEFLSSVSVQN